MALLLGISTLAFFIGSIPVGFLLGRLKGVDVRLHGSGNIGATNVLRTLGKSAGLITLLLDACKGATGALLGFAITPESAPLVALASIIGHCYSPFLKFRGGKGVATGLGAFLVLAPIESLLAVGVFALTLLVTRYVALASIAAATSLPLIISTVRFEEPLLLAAAVISALLITWRHEGNIRRLLAGNEHRLTPRPRT